MARSKAALSYTELVITHSLAGVSALRVRINVWSAWDTARMRFELFSNCPVVRPRGKFEP